MLPSTGPVPKLAGDRFDTVSSNVFTRAIQYCHPCVDVARIAPDAGVIGGIAPSLIQFSGCTSGVIDNNVVFHAGAVVLVTPGSYGKNSSPNSMTVVSGKDTLMFGCHANALTGPRFSQISSVP